MEVSFAQTCAELLGPGSQGAARALASWRARPGYADVVRFVEGFTHRALFDVGPAQVRETISKSSHALGDVQSTEQLRHVEDFTTPFAFQHLFHWYIESKNSLPT
jgi:hypothetical protein